MAVYYDHDCSRSHIRRPKPLYPHAGTLRHCATRCAAIRPTVRREALAGRAKISCSSWAPSFAAGGHGSRRGAPHLTHPSPLHRTAPPPPYPRSYALSPLPSLARHPRSRPDPRPPSLIRHGGWAWPSRSSRTRRDATCLEAGCAAGCVRPLVSRLPSLTPLPPAHSSP